MGPNYDVACMTGAEWQLPKVYAAVRVLIPSQFNLVTNTRWRRQFSIWLKYTSRVSNTDIAT